MVKPTLPLDGYVRVSRVGSRSGEGFISPTVQEDAIRAWAERTGVDVVMQPHELNVSGGTMDRPIFNDTMDRIRAGKAGGIVVYKTDRFARSLLGAITTLAELGKLGAMFASATEPELDYTEPTGRAFLQQMFVFAEYLRGTLKEGWAVAQREATERGIHIAPNGFLGYDKVLGGKLVPNEQAPTVVEAFLRRGSGESWGSLAVWLNDVAPKPDGTLWTPQAVQRLCEKRVYRGEASRYVNQDVDGRGPIVVPDAHPALVTEEQWRAANVKGRPVGGSLKGESDALLAGLIRCQGCRYSLSLGRGPKGERLYRCRRRHASGTCQTPAYVIAEAIEEHIEAAVLAELDGIARLVPDNRERDEALIAVTRAREDLDGFRHDREARRKLGAQWHDWLDDYLRAVREAEADLERVDARSAAVSEGLTRDHYLALPVLERREVLGGFIDCVFVRRSVGRGRNVDPIDQRTRILWRGQAPADLPRRRVVNPVVPFDFGEHDIEAGMAATQDSAEGLEARPAG
jgi:DNA invertase Pin-like site-specific DNA recombinase